MIAFGCAVTNTEIYERCAAPGIARAAEADSEMLVAGSVGSLPLNYNMLLDRAARIEGIEALVLVHQDAEIVSDDFCDRVREALRDPAVAIVGCVGAVGVRDIAWWEGSVTWASFTHRYPEHGGGEFGGLSWVEGGGPTHAVTGEVDSIDGFVMAISPAAMRSLRFDEGLGPIHGYDFDICCQARAAGSKVVTADLRVVHHHSLGLVGDIDAWIDAYVATVEKWEGRLPGIGGADTDDWKRRARLAEATAAATRIQVGEGRMLAEAQVRRIEGLERELDSVRRSPSWRLTAPLRALGRLRGRRRAAAP